MNVPVPFQRPGIAWLASRDPAALHLPDESIGKKEDASTGTLTTAGHELTLTHLE